MPTPCKNILNSYEIWHPIWYCWTSKAFTAYGAHLCETWTHPNFLNQFDHYQLVIRVSNSIYKETWPTEKLGNLNWFLTTLPSIFYVKPLLIKPGTTKVKALYIWNWYEIVHIDESAIVAPFHPWPNFLLTNSELPPKLILTRLVGTNCR